MNSKKQQNTSPIVARLTGFGLCGESAKTKGGAPEGLEDAVIRLKIYYNPMGKDFWVDCSRIYGGMRSVANDESETPEKREAAKVLADLKESSGLSWRELGFEVWRIRREREK